MTLYPCDLIGSRRRLLGDFVTGYFNGTRREPSIYPLSQIKVLHRVNDVLFWVSPLLAAMTEKEGVRVIRPVRSERSVPGYKTGRTGRTGRDRQGRPPRLADADTTDTEVALIPITDREGPTREGRALSLSFVSGVGTAQVLRYILQTAGTGRKGSCDGPRLPGTYVTNLAGAQVLIMPKKAETRHAPVELITEGDKGGRQGRPLLLPRGTVPSRGTPKIALLFPKVVTGPLGTLPPSWTPLSHAGLARWMGWC